MLAGGNIGIAARHAALIGQRFRAGTDPPMRLNHNSFSC
jgi:hypothetical protein